MPGQRPLRSVLYVPGDNERAMQKAPGLQMDAIIYDLEDAVAPPRKEAARQLVCQAVSRKAPRPYFLTVRLNDLSSPLGIEDLDLVLEAGPDALVLPKVDTVKDLVNLSARIEAHANKAELAKLQIWAMIETSMGVLNVKEIAELSKNIVPRLGALVLGTNDLGKQTGVAQNKMDPWRMDCVLAAKAYDLVIIDGVYNEFQDRTGLHHECERGKGMGFDGKTLIHPAQIEVSNKVFSPSEEQLQEALELKALFERAGNEHVNVLEMSGRMVERLHYEMALNTLIINKMIKERRQ